MNFWIIVAILIVIALLLVLTPVWRKEGSNGPARNTLLVILATLPLTTLGIYLYLGAPAIINEQALTEAHNRRDPDGMLQALEKKLAQSPEDAEGWYTLGRAYVEMKRMDEALKALDRARQLAPQNASYLAQYAEALALVQGSLLGEPLQLAQAALEINYEEEKALELAGLAAFQQEKWAESLHYWRRLLKRLPKDSEMYESIARAISIAEQKVETAGLGDRAKLQPPPMAKQPH